MSLPEAVESNGFILIINMALLWAHSKTTHKPRQGIVIIGERLLVLVAA